MSTPFYDLASLVVVPSGYKASKVYAQKPLTTDGQLTFSRASTATRVNASGLIETVSSNVPRLDYLNSSCPRLLLEPQRTNLALYSEQTDNAYWGKYQCTITANDTTSPDGYTNADKLTNTISTGSGVVYKALTSISAGAQTMSFFIKAGTGSVGRLAFYDGTTTFSADYNLTSGTASNVTAGATTSMSDYGNGWWRCTLTATSVAGTHYLDYGIVNSAIGQYAYIYGLQFESVAAYATSYIPTLGAAVTRGADAASKTGISSLIGQTEGTVYVKFKFNAKQGMAFQIATSSGYENAIYLERITDSFMAVQCWVSGVQQVSILLGGLVDGQTYSVAVAYKANDFAVYRDGALVNTDTSASLPASFNNFYLGNFGGAAGYETTINQALLFKTRLTNAQLAELTAL